MKNENDEKFLLFLIYVTKRKCDCDDEMDSQLAFNFFLWA